MPSFRRFFLFLFLVSSFAVASSAQESIKSLALSIQEQSSDPLEQNRLLFQWIATHIQYDLSAKRDSKNSDSREAAEQCFRRKKGVCEDYTDLYLTVAEELHLSALKVHGVCKQNHANDDTHSWLIIFAGDRWRLVDPTWGAGYTTDKGFVSRVNDSFFDISPDSLIATHYPFDPIFQLLEKPYNLDDFLRKNTKERKGLGTIHFNDSLVEYNYSSDIQRLRGKIARMQSAGLNHPLVREHFQLQKNNLKILTYNENVRIFNLAVEHYNNGQELYSKIASDPRSVVFTACYEHLSMALRLLNSIDGKESSLQNDTRDLRKQLKHQLSRMDSPYPPLENGDLIFVEMCPSDFSEAIVAVTESADSYAFSHVGIVESNVSGTFVLEAIGKGVVATPIEEFWENPAYYRFRVARLRKEYQKYIPQAIAEARRHLGKGYDYPFDFDNDRYYCSELLYVAFTKASGDSTFFPTTPMTFIDPRVEDYSPNWISYFARLKRPIPEGKPGVSPGGISRSEKIFWVK